MNIRYTLPDAERLSPRGNPIPLFALGVQGQCFNKGDAMPLNNTSIIYFNTGVLLHYGDNFGIVMTYRNLEQPGLVISGGSFVVPKVDRYPIMIPMASNGISLVEYGQQIAELYFFKEA